MKRFALIAVLCLLANMSLASFEGGNTLFSELQECEKIERGDTSVGYFKCGFATGYIAGISDSARYNGVFCPPSQSTVQQHRDVVYLWLKNNPADRSYNAESLVTAALKEAWPCPEK